MISSNTEPRPWAISTSHSTAPSSQPLRAAYISQVIAVQAASPAAAARVGEGPRSAPPAVGGLVDHDRVAAVDLDLVRIALATASDDSHQVFGLRARGPANSSGSSTSAKRAIA